MKEYLWPGSGEPMHRAIIKLYSDMGLRYENLLKPECWDCSGPTKEMGPNSSLPLKYSPYCRECGDKRFEARMQEMRDSYDAWERRELIPNLEARLAEMSAMMRNPTTKYEARDLLVEIIRDSGEELAELKSKHGVGTSAAHYS